MVLLKSLTFKIPFVPSSTKNSRRLFRRGEKAIGSLPSKRAEKQKPVIQGLVRRALAALDEPEGRRSMFGDDEVVVRIDHYVDRGYVQVEVESIGPKPNGRSGRGQDLDNTASAIMDAMNELAYDDDRGVSKLHVERVFG